MNKPSTIKTGVMQYGVPGIALMFALCLLSLHSYLLFHCIAEGFSIVVACGTFLVAWHTRKYAEKGFLLFLGTAYLTVGGIDFFHTITYRGMGIFSGGDSNIATQFWVAARSVQSISLLLVVIFVQRRFRAGVVILIYATVFFLVVALIMWWKIFPRCYIPNAGLTLFKEISEYIITLILSGTILLLFNRREQFEQGTFRMLTASIIITMLSEFSFTLYSDPYGLSNMVGHLLKIAAFFLVYRAIIVETLEKPYGTLFSNLSAANIRLHSSEEHFRKLFELASVGKAEADPTTGQFVRVNQQMCEITGYREKELLNLTYSDITFPDDRAEDRRTIDTVIQMKQKSWNTEKRYIKKGGEVIWVAVYGAVIDSGNDKRLRTIADIIDITDRKSAEERLRFHADVLRQVEDMVVMTDNGGVVLYMNRCAAEEYGVDPETVIGSNVSAVYQNEWIEPDDKTLYLRALQETGRWHGENIHRKSSGEKIIVQSSISIVKDAAGAVKGLLAVMNNITSRKESDRKIVSLAKFPEEDPFPVMRLDSRGTILYANKPARSVLDEWRCSIGETVGSEQCAPLHDAVESGTQQIFEIRQGDRWYSLAVVPVSGQGYINVYGRDITDVKLFQDALAISEQRYALAQRAANIGTWDLHIASGKLHWSEHIEPMFGMEAGSFDNRFESFMTLVHPDDRHLVTDALQNSMNNGTEYSVEHRIIRPDGTLRWMLECALLLPDQTGDNERMIGIVTDITQQYQTKESLVKSMESQAEVLADTQESLVRVSVEKLAAEEQLHQRQQALESIYSIITSTDTSLPLVGDRVVTDIALILSLESVVFFQLIDGRAVAPVLYRQGNIFHEEALSVPCSACRTVLESGKPFQCTGNLSERFPDSKCFTTGDYRSHITVPVTNYNGETVGIICVMRRDENEFQEYERHLIEIFARYIAYEITRRNLEKKMQQSQEMHLLGQLTSGVAHEVRNPLNSLMAISEALFKRMGNTEAYNDYIVHIRNQIKRLSRLMEDLLAFGRPLRNDDFQVTALGALVSDTVSEWKSISSDRVNRVRLTVPPAGVAIPVRIDVTKIQQVIVNILDNAEHHLQPGGIIAVSFGITENNRARILFQDDGSGIAENDLPRIFDPFFTTRKAGTGLGLSIVKTTIQNHGGEIRIFNNAPHPGITVEITLPVVTGGGYDGGIG